MPDIIPTFTGHLDMALSNYAKAYRQADDVTDLIFPRVPVLRQRDAYYVYGKEALQLTEQTLRAPGAPAAETRFALSTDTYFAASHALKSVIPDEDKLNYSGDLVQDAVDLNQQKIIHDRAFRAKQLITNPANYPAANTLALSGTAQWDNAASDPLGIARKARTQIARIAVKPNAVLLGFDVAEALRTNPALLIRFQNNVVTGALSDQQLALVLNVDRVIVGGMVSADPVTGIGSFDYSNFALFFYSNQVSGAAGTIDPTKPVGSEGLTGYKQISFGKSFTWTGGPQTVDGYGVVIGRHPDPTAKADIVGVDWYSTEKITAPEAGFLVTNCLAAPAN